MKYKKMKKAAVIAFACSLACSALPAYAKEANNLSYAVSKQKEAGEVIENVTFEHGEFSPIENGYVLRQLEGNNHVISNANVLSFQYETEIEWTKGFDNDQYSSSLMFGCETNNGNPIGLYGLEFAPNGNNKVKMKLFRDLDALGDSEIYKGEYIEEINLDDFKIKVSLRVDEAKDIFVSIDGKKEMKLPLAENKGKEFKARYVGGYLGMMTYRSEANFTNIKFTKYSSTSNSFETNLKNIRGKNGIWKETSDGLFSAGWGDNFAVSDSFAKDVHYSANIKNNENRGAGSLMFGVSDINNPSYNSYVVNIDYQNKVFKMFQFGGGTIKEIPLSQVASKEDGSYDLDVYVKNQRVYVEVNGTGIMDVILPNYQGGNLGLLTWDGNVTYNHVMFDTTDITIPDITHPTLQNLEILTKGVTITPMFDAHTHYYGIDIPSEVGKTVLKLTSDVEEMYINIKDENGNLIREVKLNNENEISILDEDFIDRFLKLEIILKNEGFSVTYYFAINHWFNPQELAAQENRSQFHVTPMVNFMNDPNGMVYDSTDGYWHLFYQYSTKNTFHEQSWAHVRSKDLVNWEQQPLGLQIDENGLMFSGSAVEDKENTSGLFTDNKSGESKLVALYTQDTPGIKQQQCLAYSKDHGRTWVKYDGNPVVDSSESISGVNFRDPKVFKIDGDDKWYMVTAGGKAQIHVSEDLIHWEKSQALTYKDGSNIESECPMLYPAKVNGTGETKWIYGGSAGFYVVGSMKKEGDVYKWHAESDKLNVEGNENPWGGFGKYATMTFYEDGANKNRTIGISWLQDTGINFEGKLYWGQQSLPQEYGLKQKEDGSYIITCKPVEEVNLLHDMDNIIFEGNDISVNEKTPNILKGVSGIRYDLDATIALGDAKEFGFKLRKGNGQEMIYSYDVESEKMTLDIRNAGYHQNSGNYSQTLKPIDGKISLRAIIDQGAVEVFGNEDEANISTVLYQNNENIGMEFYSVGGSVKIEDISIYDMKSMYSKKSGSELQEYQLSLNALEEVEVNSIFEVEANIYPNLKESQNIEWIYDDGLEKVSEGKGEIRFTAKKPGIYSIKAQTPDGSLEKEISVYVYANNLVTNIDDWKIDGQLWKYSAYGIRGDHAGVGDTFLLSDYIVKANEPFIYEADLHLYNGQAAGLVFGVSDKNNPGAHWYCINVDKEIGGGIAKLFENNNGQTWDVQRPLSKEEKKAKDYHLRMEYDGKVLTYYLNDVLVGTKDVAFTGGHIGLLTFHADAAFNNIMLSTAVHDESIELLENVEIFVGHDKTELLNKLPEKVKINQEDGTQREAVVEWNISDVDFNTPNEYIVYGVVENSLLKAEVKVVVKENKALSVIEDFDDIKVQEGKNADEFTKMLPKTAVVKYADDSIMELPIVWDIKDINLMKPGKYVLNGEVAETELKISMNVIVLEKEMTHPINPDDNQDDEIISPETGDASNSMILYVLLFGSIAVLMQYSKKRN